MKKTYVKPEVNTDGMITESLICDSEYIRSNFDIDYGGVDTNGEKDPAANRNYIMWEYEVEF